MKAYLTQSVKNNVVYNYFTLCYTLCIKVSEGVLRGIKHDV